MTRSLRRGALAGGLVVVLAVALAVYLGLPRVATNGVAKERKAPDEGAPVTVSVATVVQQTVPVRLQAIGNVEAFSTVAVKARVDGQIVAVNFKEGQEVRKGAVLFRLDARPFEAALKQAEANALRDSASLEQARSQERRYRELLEKNFISKEAYAQFSTNAETADATAAASRAAVENARINLDYCTIVSPIDGFVGRVLLQVGNLVKANDVNSLVVINQVRPIFVTFAVPEQNLDSIRQRTASGPLQVEVAAPGSASGRAEGRLVFIDNAVDPSTGTIKLRAQFDNADARLWPGQFVTASLKLYDQKDAVLVPAAAVQTGPEGEYVFVVKADSTAEVRKVEVARAEGERAVIGQGLAQGEKVVTRGQLRVTPGARLLVRQDP